MSHKALLKKYVAGRIWLIVHSMTNCDLDLLKSLHQSSICLIHFEAEFLGAYLTMVGISFCSIVIYKSIWCLSLSLWGFCLFFSDTKISSGVILVHFCLFFFFILLFSVLLLFFICVSLNATYGSILFYL